MKKILLVCILACCGFGAAASTEPPMRLGDAVTPRAYQLELRVDPDQSVHSGRVVIDVQIKRATRRLRLHARDLQIDSALLSSAGRAHVHAADVDSIWLDFDKPAPAGRARLSLSFHGHVSETDEFGLFRQKDGGAWYAFTQFEDVGARRAFPLFDEPGWKVPWTLSLVVPEKQTAVANAPVLSEKPAGPGWKRVSFKTTTALPSYLLAFGVGPFDILDGGRVGAVPLRYVTPKGRSGEASFAAAQTPAVVEHLQAYFGMPFPFEKFDSLAIPVGDLFGAMENPGLIIYGGQLMLAPAGQQTQEFQREYLSVAAHEIAHQWNGDLVTMAWWDDLWLNESFASWMGDKIVRELRPEWRWESSTLKQRARAMRGDMLPSARRVRQPVQTRKDLDTAFDEITYAKGQSVLTMFEAWMGPQAMQASVRRYIASHAGRSATGDDFLHALAQQDEATAAAFATFIDQPGVPELRMELQCEGEPRLHVTQSRYHALGSAELPGHWQVPLMLRTPAGLTRYLMSTDEASVPLPDKSCPSWLLPNVDGAGYYRAAVAPALLQAGLREGQPNASELQALLDDQTALAESGDVPQDAVLVMIQALAGDPRLAVSEAAAEALRQLGRLVAPEQRAAYARLWQQSFGPSARQLGWLPVAGEDEDQRLRRESLLPMVADLGDDKTLQRQALALTASWLAVASRDGGSHPQLLDPGMRAAVLRSAALEGDEPLFDQILQVARMTPERRLHRELFEALASFRSPQLAARARALLLDPELDFQEMLVSVKTRQGAQAGAPALLEFFERHQAELRPRFATLDLAGLPMTWAASGCSTGLAERLQEVFGAVLSDVDGGPGNLAKATDSVRLCAAYRQAQAPALQAFLNRLE